MTKSIMFQGTGSNVGKSIICAAICRILKDEGYNVAPFKSQNMALNSAVSEEGLEMGRAQAFQAECAGIKPSVNMNPVLLKPTGNQTSQVIILGESHGLMSARKYHKYKKNAWDAVKEGYRQLTNKYDAIVIEGAGSPAEINIKSNDIVNMRVAIYTKSPVLLIGDINLGGVFAWLLGTLKLLTPEERKLVKGIIINKFRGDKSLLKPGLDYLNKSTGKKVLGVLPYFENLLLDDEDSLALDQRSDTKNNGIINIEVIRLPRISNFTDFDPFKHDPLVKLSFVEELSGKADMLIIPGSKNSIEDMKFIINRNLDKQIISHFKSKKPIWGICGGLQILGATIEDPFSVESKSKKIKGLALLDVKTIYSSKKQTKNRDASLKFGNKTFSLKGYEIHYGTSRHGKKSTPFIFGADNDEIIGLFHKNIYGTYLHGIFNNDGFRRAFLDSIIGAKGRATNKVFSYDREKEKSIQKLAQIVRENLDMKQIYKLIK